MINTKSTLPALLLLGVCLTASYAQESDPDQPKGDRPPMNRPHFPPPLLAAMDTDKDGTLSSGELANAAVTLLTLDTNKDGALTMEELHPKPPTNDQPNAGQGDKPRHERGDRPKGDHGPGHHPPMPLLEALDLDKDGNISAEEITKAPISLKTLDKNNDGALTQDELRPPPPPPRDGEDRPELPDGAMPPPPPQ